VAIGKPRQRKKALARAAELKGEEMIFSKSGRVRQTQATAHATVLKRDDALTWQRDSKKALACRVRFEALLSNLRVL
jgi:hypothetical protein